MSFRPKYVTLLALLLLGLFSSQSVSVPFTRPQKIFLQAEAHGFNYTAWMLDALALKLRQATLGTPHFFDAPAQHQVVTQTLDLIRQMEKVEAEIEQIYADPANAADPQSASAAQRVNLDDLNRQYDALAPFAEAVLESQVSAILSALDLTLGGQPEPKVLYHVSPLPQNLVISRREVIQQETSVLLDPNLTTDQAQQLETEVDRQFGVSSLVVPVGGVALYPTMVYRTSDIYWLVETIAHEWTHVYMAKDPLSLNYENDFQVRTMNETTASIAGGEIGRLVMQTYYPEMLNRQSPLEQFAALNGRPPAEGFDFNTEMRITRVTADALLAAGKIDEAEAYMEARRQFFWDNGYAIRKLNQAYFAFYGAYADTPGGAAGEDPVGAAVRELRARSASLQEFLDTIRKMGSFAELQAALEQKTP